MDRRVIVALACRNNGSRLYGKPLQNLDVESNYSILDNIIACLESVRLFDEVVLGISEGADNYIFENYARERNLKFVIGDEIDVLSRLILCGEISSATDIFRVTSESPFVNYEAIQSAYDLYIGSNLDSLFLDDIVDGCGFEFISMDALNRSHQNGEPRHRSEMCSLFIRENLDQFNVRKIAPEKALMRADLRLTVDNPEDLVVCRHIFKEFQDLAPNIPLKKIISYLDKNPHLKELISPFLEAGYDTMYL